MQLFYDHRPMILPEGKKRVPSPKALFDVNLPINVIPLQIRVPWPSNKPFLKAPSQLQPSHISLPEPQNRPLRHWPRQITQFPCFSTPKPSFTGGIPTVKGLTEGKSYQFLLLFYSSRKINSSLLNNPLTKESYIYCFLIFFPIESGIFSFFSSLFSFFVCFAYSESYSVNLLVMLNASVISAFILLNVIYLSGLISLLLFVFYSEIVANYVIKASIVFQQAYFCCLKYIYIPSDKYLATIDRQCLISLLISYFKHLKWILYSSKSNLILSTMDEHKHPFFSQTKGCKIVWVDS